MINYSSILQTGIQSLLAVASGWACGRWSILDAEPTVAYTNTLVLKFCIPCLQVWLLAIKTDMREPGNWSAMFAFLFWSVFLQVLLAVLQLLRRDTVHLARLGVDSLILTTNNTGILGPVVLQAAVGPQYAPLGMLATVVLYFQQLPSAQLLFQLHQQQQQQQQFTSEHGQQETLPMASSQSLPLQKQQDRASKQQQLKQHYKQQQHYKRGQPPASWQELEQLMKNPNCTYEDIFGGNGQSTSKVPYTSKQPPRLEVPSDGGACKWRDNNSSNSSADKQQQQQHVAQVAEEPLPHIDSLSSWELQKAHAAAVASPTSCKSPFSLIQQPAAAPAATQVSGSSGGSSNPQQLPLSTVSFEIEECEEPGSPGMWGSGAGSKQQQQRQLTHQHGSSESLQQRHKQGGKQTGHHILTIGTRHSPFSSTIAQSKSTACYIGSLLLNNPLVWSTGISLLLSSLGSSVLLDPESPLALQQFAFIEALLGWFAQTTAPLTLFTTGLWMYSNSSKLQKQQQQHGQSQGRNHEQQQDSGASVLEQLPWLQLWYYLLARATVAPGFMVFVCRLMGFRGDLAHALVILSLLPVAQTAFVVCKQAEVGTHAVSVVMVASLLLMLPQLMLMLALLEWLGVFS